MRQEASRLDRVTETASSSPKPTLIGTGLRNDEGAVAHGARAQPTPRCLKQLDAPRAGSSDASSGMVIKMTLRSEVPPE